MVTLDDERFITPEQCGHSFPNQVVKLKYFDAFDGIAARLDIDITATTPFATVTGDPSRKPVMRKDRKGQPIFRQNSSSTTIDAAFQGMGWGTGGSTHSTVH